MTDEDVLGEQREREPGEGDRPVDEVLDHVERATRAAAASCRTLLYVAMATCMLAGARAAWGSMARVFAWWK